MWIVTFRDYAISLGSLGDEEAFIHSSSKVYYFINQLTHSIRLFFFVS